MDGEHKIEYFNENIDCLKEIRNIRSSHNRIFIDRGKNERGYYVKYMYRWH